MLPENADPDEFIRKFGVAEYQQRRAKAQPHIQFVIDQAVGDRSLHRPAEKAEAVEEVLPYIRAVRNRIQKREYFDMAMDALRIGDVALRRELWQTLRSDDAESGRAGQKILKRSGVKPTVAEQRLLELLLTHEDLRRIFLPRLELEDFADLPTAAIFRALLEIEKEGAPVDFEVLNQKTEGDSLAAELLPMLLMGDAKSAEDGKVDDILVTAEKCLDALRLVRINHRIRELGVEIASAERLGDEAQVARLSSEYSGLDRLRKSFEPQSQIAQAENR